MSNEKVNTRFTMRFKDIDIYEQIRNISYRYNMTVNEIINEVLKYGLPVYKKALECNSEEEISPSENQNYAKILKHLNTVSNDLEICKNNIKNILYNQSVMLANTEVIKHINSSIYSRQKLREAENPNLRILSEEEERIFDKVIPSTFVEQYNKYIIALSENEEDDE